MVEVRAVPRQTPKRCRPRYGPVASPVPSNPKVAGGSVAERIRREDTARKPQKKLADSKQRRSRDERRRAEIERKKEEASREGRAVEETDKARLEREAAKPLHRRATEQKAGSPASGASDRVAGGGGRGPLVRDDEFGDGKQRRRREITLKPDLRRPKTKVTTRRRVRVPTEIVKRVQVPEAITVGDLATDVGKAMAVIKTPMGRAYVDDQPRARSGQRAILVIEEMGHVAKPSFRRDRTRARTIAEHRRPRKRAAGQRSWSRRPR